MAVRAIAVKNGEVPETWRQALGLFAFPGGGALERRGGLAPATGTADLVGTTPMNATVGPFVAWVDGTSGAKQGGYIVVNDDDHPVDFDPGEASVARNDQVIIQVKDNVYDSSGEQDVDILVLKGNSGGGASTVPASSEVLWNVPVPAGASIGGGGFDVSAVRQDRRRWTSALGGTLLVKDQADRDTLTPHEGEHIWRLDAGDRQIYRGGGWRWDGVPRTATKTAAQQVGNDTFTVDNHLQLSLPPGTWDIELIGNYSADTDQDLKIGFNAPASSVMTWLVLGKGGATQADGPLGQPDWIPQGVTGDPRLGGRVTTDNTGWMAFWIKGWLTTTTAGTLQFKWAQNVTNGLAPTWMHPGSRLIAKRIGD